MSLIIWMQALFTVMIVAIWVLRVLYLLDCSALYNNGEFKLLLKDIGRLASKYNIQLKQNKTVIPIGIKKILITYTRIWRKPWDALVPLTDACRNISRNIRM